MLTKHNLLHFKSYISHPLKSRANFFSQPIMSKLYSKRTFSSIGNIGYLHEVDLQGKYRHLGSGDWTGTEAMTSIGNTLGFVKIGYQNS